MKPVISAEKSKAVQTDVYRQWVASENKRFADSKAEAEKEAQHKAEIKQAITQTRESCAKALDVSNAAILLMAGEMDAETLRTVQAVLKGMQFRIRNQQ